MFFVSSRRSVTPTLSSPSPASETNASEENAAPVSKIDVDSSKPTTNIQIRLADGSRLVGTFNYHHTVGDIRSYINAYPFSFTILTYFLAKR